MGCNRDKCKSYNLGTASEEEYHGHATWKQDYAADGMTRYGVYYSVPCLKLLITYFGAEKYPDRREFMGIIDLDDYGMRTASLLRLSGPAQAELVWKATYDPGQCGAEPYDALYAQHAIALGNLGANNEWMGW